ncbi:MAG TPA: metallophosphoesterase [Pyrinomonadaceae bacterium]|nr:metallophosphoesterase [Pyrinomonadaceae bacterium]
MANKPPVIVSYEQLNKAVRKALAKDPHSILKTSKKPVPKGYESFESAGPPATAKQAARQVENLTRALKVLEKAQKHKTVLAAPDDQFTSLLQSRLAELSLDAGKVKRAKGMDVLEAQFDEHDLLGWGKSLFSWIKGLRPHKWQTAPATPDKLPNDVRVAILGDWGTGLYGAPDCARSIEKDKKDYGLLLHLGDVYYSGTDKEVVDRFLNLWPKNPNAISRACNSNHEMYSGGYAYFDQTLKKFKQPASYFALQNDNWLLVGLDSAYKEWELANDQVSWLKSLLAKSGNRKVILLSHHQPFSWMETTKSKMQSELGEILTNKKICAWYWGHEHRCMVYDKHPVWDIYGRCIGHSGYPYFTDKNKAGTVTAPNPKAQGSWWRTVPMKNMVPGGIILEGPNPYVTNHEKEYGPNGYMTLEFSGAQLNEIIHMPDGSRVFDRQLI